jgi:hypothetical protein
MLLPYGMQAFVSVPYTKSKHVHNVGSTNLQKTQEGGGGGGMA